MVHFNVTRNWFETNLWHQTVYSEGGKKSLWVSQCTGKKNYISNKNYISRLLNFDDNKIIHSSIFIVYYTCNAYLGFFSDFEPNFKFMSSCTMHVALTDFKWQIY